MGLNPGYQSRALFEMRSGWRLTGLRLEGPSVWLTVTNSQHTVSYQGEAMAIRVDHRDYDALPEIDNVWMSGWSYMSVNLYRGPALLHHFRAFYNRRSGFGYGIYPGRDAKDSDGITTVQRTVAGHVHAYRHGTDGSASAFSDQGMAISEVEHAFESLVFSGANDQETLNHHVHTYERQPQRAASGQLRPSPRDLAPCGGPGRAHHVRRAGGLAAPRSGLLVGHLARLVAERSMGADERGPGRAHLQQDPGPAP